MLQNNFDIVCVSVMDWEHPFQSSRHHLMRELSRRHRVLFVDNQVNPIRALARWRERPMRGTCARWSKLTANPRPLGPNLWGYTPPPVVPMGRLTQPRAFAAAYALNQAVLKAGVRRACGALGFERPLLWISFNVLSSESLIGALNERLVIYHCTDEIGAMADTSVFAPEIERRLLARADLVFASSRQLAEDKAFASSRCHFVPNGADITHFEKALDPTLAPHPCLAEARSSVRLGFCGHMEERFDFALVGAVALARPEWTFFLAGPVSPSRRAEAKDLAALPNVRFVGLLPRAELPAFLAGVDVALIPFVHSAQTRAIYPLKLNEYLAAGKPVVATPFADLTDFADRIGLADGPVAFEAAIARSLAEESPLKQAERVALAATNGWAGRAAAMEALIADALKPSC